MSQNIPLYVYKTNPSSDRTITTTTTMLLPCTKKANRQIENMISNIESKSKNQFTGYWPCVHLDWY